MNKMSQQERASARRSMSVWVAEPVPIESQEGLDSARERIMAGRAFLKVVEYPWGVEFGVCEVRGQQ